MVFVLNFLYLLPISLEIVLICGNKDTFYDNYLPFFSMYDTFLFKRLEYRPFPIHRSYQYFLRSLNYHFIFVMKITR